MGILGSYEKIEASTENKNFLRLNVAKMALEEYSKEISRNEGFLKFDKKDRKNTNKKDRKNAKSKNQEETEEIDDLVETEMEIALNLLESYPCLGPSLESYVSLIKQKVIGQDKAIEKLVFIAYLNQYVNFLEEFSEMQIAKRKSMFLIAPTGMGKTTIFKALEKVFQVPIYHANITAITSAGYIGDNIESFIIGLLKRANWDVGNAERGILLIDEIDKKITSETREKDVSGKAVQQELLKFFDGSKINVTVNNTMFEFDTSNLTIIFTGACVGLDEIRNKRLGKNKIGFDSDNSNSQRNNYEYTKKDLINYGFIPELIGRIDIIEEMRKLTKQDIIDIIYFSEESSLRENINILNTLGVENITIDGYLWECLAEEIVNGDVGIRELNSKIGELFMPIISEAFGHTDDGTCIIEADGSYTLTYVKEQKEYKGRGLKVDIH